MLMKVEAFASFESPQEGFLDEISGALGIPGKSSRNTIKQVHLLQCGTLKLFGR